MYGVLMGYLYRFLIVQSDMDMDTDRVHNPDGRPRKPLATQESIQRCCTPNQSTMIAIAVMRLINR